MRQPHQLLLPPPSIRVFSTTTMATAEKEAQIGLAIAAIQENPTLSVREAGRIYHVSHDTIQRRMAGILPKAGTHAATSKLTTMEEDVIIQYILDLDSRGFLPSKADVEDMVNLLLAKRDASPVGKCWTNRFISRQPGLSTHLNRAYDYQRAL